MVSERSTRDGVARMLADAHFQVEPGISRIRRVVRESGPEDAHEEPIKLLEVNRNTIPVGIRPVFFGPDPAAGILFPSAVIEVTPEEYEAIEAGRLQLPEHWRLEREYQRPATATAG